MRKSERQENFEFELGGPESATHNATRVVGSIVTKLINWKGIKREQRIPYIL